MKFRPTLDLLNSWTSVSCQTRHKGTAGPHRMSRVLLLHKKNIDDTSAKSYILMRNMGLVQSILSGFHYLLPIATRSLTKLISLIDQEMESLGAQKVILPTLGQLELLKISGKWNEHHPDIFNFDDRQNQRLFLTPTHEEMFCHWLSKEKIFEKYLPLYLYQTTSKFRDEARPRGGLLRGREFLMKDLYCFDVDEAAARKSYELVCQGYQNIFDRLQVSVIKTQADTGLIGGKHSHEYHLISGVGEDKIFICSQCNQGFSSEYLEKHQPNQGNQPQCDSCKSDLKEANSIEIGHAFYLGTRYTDPFKCFYRSSTNQFRLLEMGSYGLGVTRILASCAEVLSKPRELKWPDAIAPFHVTVIPPKEGSKEAHLNQLAEDLANHLATHTSADVIIDDRIDWTIGNRMYDSLRLGIPITIVVGKKGTSSIPLFEYIHHVNHHHHETNNIERVTKEMSFVEIVEQIKSIYPIP